MRARLVRAVVQLDIVLDDGEVLTAVPIDPIVINAADWADWSVTDVLAEVERLVAQREATPVGTNGSDA